jgi:TRAP-type C4-dicarboxylate transport system substrate-binding protein
MKRRLMSFFGVTMTIFILTAAMFCTAVYAKTMTLKFASPVPPKSWIGQQQQWWGSEVEKRTNGRVKVQFFWMGSLVEWKDGLHGVGSGICDIANPCSTYHPSEFPLYIVLDMPYNGNDYWAAMRAAIDTVENQPDLKAEFERNGVKFLFNWMSGFFHPATTKHVNSIEDLKGKTFRSFGGARIKWMEYLGINPVFMSYAEIYEAADRGTIDGVEIVLMLSDAFKHYEVCTDVLLADSGFVVTCAATINLKTWNSLPKDIQEIMLKLREDYAAHYAKGLMALESQIIEKWKTKYGLNIRPLSPEDDKIAREAGRKAQEYFLNKQEAEGHPARKVWDYYSRTREKYENIIKTKGYPWEIK